jgi:hypothetical protein
LKLFRPNKMLGLAIGERSLLAAQLVAADRPRVQRLGEFVYPEGITLTQADKLGAELGRFLREHGITARQAVVGLPAKWLLVKSKDVPSADDDTTSRMLRLQAETEFSSELNDLVCDYIPSVASIDKEQRAVLLLATQQQYLAQVKALCKSAGLRVGAVMPQATALAAQGSLQDPWILHLHAEGAELSVQNAGAPAALRHLRTSVAQPQFAGELRRALASIGSGRRPEQLLIWNDAPFDSESLTRQIGLPMRIGQLSDLGVDLHLNGTAPADGQIPGGQYAPAVALALAGLDERPAINFLRSRLAPPKTRRVPRWSVLAAAALLILVVGIVYAWRDLQQQESGLQTLQSRLDSMSGEIKAADSFVSMVNFASHWHGGQSRYLLCLRGLTLAVPEDGQTYATNLILRDPAASPSAVRPTGPNAPSDDTTVLDGQLFGKTMDQQAVQTLIDRLKHSAGFSDVKLGGTQNAARNGEVAFSVTFAYSPPKPASTASARQEIGDNKSGAQVEPSRILPPATSPAATTQSDRRLP